jgi:glycerol-3-phosphate dehydrogenase
MTDVLTDIFIIGGGINGAGIACDAAGRNLSVTLVEQSDLASGTSSTSSKLIHGGLRYLTTYDFSLVRKALQEREILLRKAPHIITPLEFVLPHAKHLRPAWLIRVGLFIYDHLAAHPLLPNSKKINLTEDARGKALLPDITNGFSYYDCFDDDARLVVLNALAAQSHGATILTRTTCVSANYKNQRWEIQTKNLATNEIATHYAKVLVNAAGPWILQTQEKVIQANNPFAIELVKGTHIVVPKLYDGDFAYILQNPDERVVFAIPYEQDFTLIGTTDVPYTADLSNITSSADEENYLCETINRYFKKSITPKDIVWSYAGVRCLQEDAAQKASEITRDYKFELNAEIPLLTVISGKITTYRCLAEEAVDTLKKYFPTLAPAWTATGALPGGDFLNGDFEKFYEKVCGDFTWLPAKLARRYARSYGTRIYLLLQNTQSMVDLGKDYGAQLFQKEIDYLIQHEWAKTADDILWRRTKLGLFFTADETQQLVNTINNQK